MIMQGGSDSNPSWETTVMYQAVLSFKLVHLTLAVASSR